MAPAGEHGGTRLASLDLYGQSSMGEQVRGMRPKTPLKSCRDAVDVSGRRCIILMGSQWTVFGVDAVHAF
jgi:hypothetical protein